MKKKNKKVLKALKKIEEHTDCYVKKIDKHHYQIRCTKPRVTLYQNASMINIALGKHPNMVYDWNGAVFDIDPDNQIQISYEDLRYVLNTLNFI